MIENAIAETKHLKINYYLEQYVIIIYLLTIFETALAMFSISRMSNVWIAIIRSVKQLISMLWPQTKIVSSRMQGA